MQVVHTSLYDKEEDGLAEILTAFIFMVQINSQRVLDHNSKQNNVLSLSKLVGF